MNQHRINSMLSGSAGDFKDRGFFLADVREAMRSVKRTHDELRFFIETDRHNGGRFGHKEHNLKIVDEGTIINVEKGVTKRIHGTNEGASILTLECDILLPCALENAITSANARDVKARLVACGANGPVSPAASAILQKNNIIEIYDFLANSGGVIASYFEWLRGITERFRFEDEVIQRQQ